MRLARVTVALIASLIAGGCATHRSSHVQAYSPQDRDWWYPQGVSSLGPGIYASSDPNALAVGDALGVTCFYDSVGYAQAVQFRRETEFATVPDDN